MFCSVWEGKREENKITYRQTMEIQRVRFQAISTEGVSQ